MGTSTFQSQAVRSLGYFVSKKTMNPQVDGYSVAYRILVSGKTVIELCQVD